MNSSRDARFVVLIFSSTVFLSDNSALRIFGRMFVVLPCYFGKMLRFGT